MPLIELRVHGVSGTPPGEMLDVDRVRQVAGDELGRVFERADRDGEPLSDPHHHRTLAYHWGRLTSGSITQGLWLLLAPFGLVNAAQFMLEPPETKAEGRAHMVAGAALRLLGLMLTALFVLAAAVITMDLWAWQRAEAVNGAAIVLGMAGPVLLLAVYVLLARARTVPRAPVDPDELMQYVPAGERHSDLVRPGFFGGDPGANALRWLHVAHGLTLVAVLGFAPAAVRKDLFGMIGFWVAVGLLITLALCVIFLGDPERSASTTWDEEPTKRQVWVRKWSGPISVGLVGVAAFVLAVAAVEVLVDPIPAAPRNLHYGGIDWASFGILLIAMLALAVLFAANGRLAYLRRGSNARKRPAFRPYAKGLAATFVAAAGMFLGVGYAGAFTTFLASALSTETRTVAVPELLARVVYAWGITVVFAALVGLVMFARFRSTREKVEKYAVDDFMVGGTSRIPERWIAKIVAATWVARVKNRLARLLTIFVGLGLLLSFAVMVELGPLLSRDWPRLNAYPGEAWWWFAWLSASPTWPSGLEGNLAVARSMLIAIGTAALTGLATALVFLGRKALRGESGRRGINVLWDVISFWPRSAHPFVPAAYSQRAVPDLVDLISVQLADDREADLVLCGHSQGSLLSFAALLRLQTIDAKLLRRIGFLTFGSQLQVMFSRAFPAYVNHDAINRLFEALDGRWRNLYRDTDHLAGPVLSWAHNREAGMAERIDERGPQKSIRVEGREEHGPDWRLADPPIPASADLNRAVLLPLRKHSDYWLDPAWTVAVAAVRAPHDEEEGPDGDRRESRRCGDERRNGRQPMAVEEGSQPAGETR